MPAVQADVLKYLGKLFLRHDRPVKSTKRHKVALPLQRDWSGRVALVSSRTAHLHD
jgi:hypothetical protein